MAAVFIVSQTAGAAASPSLLKKKYYFKNKSV
jgi:hypothetical protein